MYKYISRYRFYCAIIRSRERANFLYNINSIEHTQMARRLGGASIGRTFQFKGFRFIYFSSFIPLLQQQISTLFVFRLHVILLKKIRRMCSSFVVCVVCLFANLCVWSLSLCLSRFLFLLFSFACFFSCLFFISLLLYVFITTS